MVDRGSDTSTTEEQISGPVSSARADALAELSRPDPPESLWERVVASLRPDAVVQVGDAKNLARALFLTLQFTEMDAPLVLDLNMTDEARQQGITIDYDRLSERLGIPVVPTIATRGKGVTDLVANLPRAAVPSLRVTYDPAVEQGLAAIEAILPADLSGRRGRAVMLLAG
ncbi:MAG TPA: FeoB small GTPase domain-containing protein, partial [Microthrixaceae bacterium]|nr:FeoB small GTPase domain-containing protein [Microthrixaceae bacterium]